MQSNRRLWADAMEFRGTLALGMALGLAIVVLPGCTGTGPTPPAPVPAKPKVAAQAPAAAPLASAEAKPPVTEVKSETPAGPPAPEPVVSRERILLLAPLSPLIVELQLTIDGRPHSEALERLVEDVLQVADADGDGRPEWKEVTLSKRFQYGQYGNLPIDNENGRKQIVETYDIDRDGLVDRTELPRFLTRNAGGSRSFSVRGTADFRMAGPQAAPLWQTIDRDGDGGLSQEELQAASGALLARDMDDDEILVSAELNPQAVATPGTMPDRRRRGPDIVRLLGPHANWDGVRSSLEAMYAGGGYLQADSFPLTPGLFARLDANKDGKLLKGEFQALNDVPPQIVVAVDFGQLKSEPAAEAEDSQHAASEAEASAAEANATESSADETESDKPAEPPAPRLKMIHLDPALVGTNDPRIEQKGRLAFRAGPTAITLYVNDTLAGNAFEAQAKQALESLDGDKNGYLEAKEVPENAAPQLGRFEAVDADEDGKVYLKEVVAYLSQQQAAMRAQIHARASDREDAPFAAVDQNRDERLDAREIEQLAASLATLDKSGDGVITSDEVPESIVIGLARGSLENMDALFTPPPLVTATPAEGAPRWFTAMDANGDGIVSPREFLGPPEKFPTLDANRDGLLDAADARQAEVPKNQSSEEPKSQKTEEPTNQRL